MSQPDQPQRDDSGQLRQQVRTQHLTARVPESVSAGVFSTGVIVMTGGTEFVLDFIQNIGQPAQVAARVVMPHAVLPQFIDALRKNWELYTQRFGAPSMPPRPPASGPRPSVQEIYDELKLPDETLSGAYANGLMIGHTASEFKLDFLTNLYPYSAVSCRVYVSAPQIPRIVESLSSTFQQFQQRVQQQQQQPRHTAAGQPPTGTVEGTSSPAAPEGDVSPPDPMSGDEPSDESASS